MFVTGFPIWDHLVEYGQSNLVASGARIITFFSQYGSERGLFGRFGVKHYIREILECLPPGNVLHVRAHPLEAEDVHSEFAPLGAVILSKSEPVELVYQRSAICISVFSFSSYEAKHICPNSFHINYDPDGVPDGRYAFFSNGLNLITCREGLLDVLEGRVVPIPTAKFLEAFNPHYPVSSRYTSEVISQLMSVPR
jgi:hypothetical protein